MTKQLPQSVSDWIAHCEIMLEAGGAWFGHGTDNAADEAAWLVLHVLAAPLDGTFDDWDRQVTRPDAERILSLLAERVNSRKPLAYLLGEAWFCGLRFQVNESVLVPRSPIAELITNEFRPWVKPETVTTALDLCTGSACIAIAMATHMPGLQLDAVDISPAALEVAAGNIARHGLEKRVRLLASDLFDAVQGRRYGLIVGNPPYVPESALASLPGEYLAEPGIGLVSGPDGLDLPLQILHKAPDYLEPGGVLVLEVGESAQRLQQLLPEVPFTWLEFEHGGEGVFTMERQALLEAQPAIGAVMEQRKNVG